MRVAAEVLAGDPLVGDDTVCAWSDLIRARLAATVESIVDTGCVLIDCKAALDHGQFEEAVRRAGISPRVAQMFMAIANHPVLSNASAYSHLPPTYSALYQLSRLEPPELTRALEDGVITPTMKVNDATQMANMAKNARARAEQDATATAAQDKIIRGEAPGLADKVTAGEMTLKAAVKELNARADEANQDGDDDFDDPIFQAGCLRMAASPRDHFEQAIEAARTKGDLSHRSVIEQLDRIEGDGMPDVSRSPDSTLHTPAGSLVEQTVGDNPSRYGFVGFELHFCPDKVMNILRAAVQDCIQAGLSPDEIIKYTTMFTEWGLGTIPAVLDERDDNR